MRNSKRRRVSAAVLRANRCGGGPISPADVPVVEEWDPERGAIAAGRDFDAVRPIADLLTDAPEGLPDHWP